LTLNLPGELSTWWGRCLAEAFTLQRTPCFALKNYFLAKTKNSRHIYLPMEIKLDGEEFILLQSLLKIAGLCDTGGAAKIAISQSQIKVDGLVETRRGKKIRAGQIVSFGEKQIHVVS
jgi:ribosome-associated protein